MPSSSSRLRFWLLYTAAWLPLLAANLAINLGDMEMPFFVALRRSVSSIVPGALLGLLVFRICRRLPSAARRPLAFLLAHLGVAICFSTVYAAFVFGWRKVEDWLTGEPRPLALGWFIWFMLTGFLIYGALAGVGYGLETAARLRREQDRAARAEALRAEAELTALRAQLNPHFLFNTLHSLLALVRHDPEHAERALEQFGDLLRYTLRVQQDTVDEVSFAEEWAFVENYLELERLRLGDRLRLVTDIEPEALRRRLPVFSLQPLVENAVRHAVAPRAAGGEVRVSARVVDGELRLEVADDGPGADAEDLENGPGMGLRIVRQRLAALSHGRAGWSVETANGRGFTVRLRIPADLAGPAGPAGATELKA